MKPWQSYRLRLQLDLCVHLFELWEFHQQAKEMQRVVFCHTECSSYKTAYHIYCNVALKNLLEVELCSATLSSSFLHVDDKIKGNCSVIL